jgi:hypothetical protein
MAGGAKEIQARLDAIIGELCGTLPTQKPRDELTREFEQLQQELSRLIRPDVLEIGVDRRLSGGFIPPPAKDPDEIPAEIADDPIRRDLYLSGRSWE